MIGAAGEDVNSPLVPVPKVIAETISGALPLFCTWVVREVEPGTTTLPKERLLGTRAMVGAGAATPAPVTVTGTVGVVASLLLTTMEPVSAPTAVGV